MIINLLYTIPEILVKFVIVHNNPMEITLGTRVSTMLWRNNQIGLTGLCPRSSEDSIDTQ